jgi:Uncharacterized ABC-type transport system, permease component
MKIKNIEDRLVPVVAFLMAVILSALVMLCCGYNPITAFRVIFKGAFGSFIGISNTLIQATPLIFTGLAFMIAKKTTMINLGVEGDFYIGALAGAVVGMQDWGLAPVLHCALVMLAAFAAGGIAGWFIGFLKVKFGSNEVITTTMTNFVLVNFTSYLVNYPLKAEGSIAQTERMQASALLPKLFNKGQLTGAIIIAAVTAILIHIFLEKTEKGLEIKAVGLNMKASETAGIRTGRVMMAAMFLSGAVAGLAGAVQVMSVNRRFVAGFSAGYGYSGIAVTALASDNALGIIISGIIFGALKKRCRFPQHVLPHPDRVCFRHPGTRCPLCFGPNPRSQRHGCVQVQKERRQKMIYGIINSTFALSIPLILAALGGVFSVRSGIMALGLESMMLFGAFTAVVGSYFSGSAAVGLLCGVLGGLVLGLLHGLFCIRYKINQVISGIGLNLLSSAASTLLMQVIWNNKGSSDSVASVTVRLSFLSKVPVLGPIFATQSILLVLTLLFAFVGYEVLFKTPFGLRMRMVGENPKAASSVGIPVHKVKYIGVAICGCLAGLGGAYLSIDSLNMFVREMSAGRGYIAVAIAILSRYNPRNVLLCGLLFGFCEAAQIYLQGYGVPSQLIQMIPYIVTLLVLVVGVKNIKPPAGVGKHEDD